MGKKVSLKNFKKSYSMQMIIFGENNFYDQTEGQKKDNKQAQTRHGLKTKKYFQETKNVKSRYNKRLVNTYLSNVI